MAKIPKYIYEDIVQRASCRKGQTYNTVRNELDE